MARKRTYFSLLVRFPDTGRWSPEFGDYTRAVVEEEMRDYRDHDYKARDLKIIATGDKPADVSAAVRALNYGKDN